MPEENNKIPEEYQPKGISLNKIILVATILIILIVIWAYFTGRLALGVLG